MENSLSTRGKLNAFLSSWRSNCLLVENLLYFIVENLLRSFRRLLYCAMFLSCSLLDCSPWTNISWWCQRYGWILSILVNLLCFSGFLPLDNSFLVVPTLRSKFLDSRKNILVVFVPCYDIHRSSSLLFPLLFMMLSQILVW